MRTRSVCSGSFFVLVGMHNQLELAHQHWMASQEGVCLCAIISWHYAMVVLILMQDYLVDDTWRNVVRALIVSGVFAAVVTLTGSVTCADATAVILLQHSCWCRPC